MELEKIVANVEAMDYVNDINAKRLPGKEKDAREELALKVAKHIADHNASTRSTAQEFGVSNVTVYALVRLIEKTNPEEFKKAVIVLEAHSGRNKSIKSPVVSKRVTNMAISYLTTPEATIESVAAEYGVSYFTAYRDLTSRLQSLNEDLAIEVAAKLSTNSIGNRGKNVKKS